MSNPKDRQLRDLIAEQAADFFVAHRDGHMTDEEEQEFLRWLRSSPAHVAEYLGIVDLAKDITETMKRNNTPLDYLIDEASDGGHVIAIDPSRFSFDNVPERQRGEKRKGFGAALFRHGFAAAVALAVIVGAALMVRLQDRASASFATAHGEQRTLQLSDNTIAHMNSDSAIVVTFDSTRRVVEVTHGEVYFEVAKDARRPFEVHASDLLLRDIGTAFDVFRQDKGTVISVAEGQVAVWKDTAANISARPSQAKMPGLLADLHAGDQVTVLPSHVVEISDSAKVKRTTAWLHQEIVFDHETIAAAAAAFNRYNQIQIVIGDPKIAALPISGRFHMYDIQTFAEVLKTLPGALMTDDGHTLRVTSRETHARGD
jgi:transmembrane sensor